MRPQHTAALAAKAAISAIPEDEQEAGETLPRGHANNDGDFTPTRAQQSVLGFKRKKTSAQLDTDDCRKIKRQEAKGENAGDEVLEKPGPDIGGPSLFDRLPNEIKMKILSEIDDDPCTLIKCLLVSKTFLDSIAYSSDPEKDWERRCKRMLTIRRYPDCETWKETYLQMVRRRCARCFKGTSARLGRLFESGPRCIVVCEACQLQPGPYQVITLENAVWQWPTIKDYLGNLRLKFRKVDDQYWVQDCLVSTVTQLANQLKTDKESVIKVPFMMDWRRGIRIYPEAV